MTTSSLTLNGPWSLEDRASAAALAGDPESYLVEKAISGDADAFARLYDIHVARVYRHAYFRVNEASEAEDITHQAFLQAWQAIGRYRYTGAPFVAWLLAITHNLIIDHFRKHPRGKTLDESVVADFLVDERSELDRGLDRDRIHQALSHLRPEQQRVITMRLIDDLDYPEIARAIGKSEGNVRVILHRSLSALRRILEPQ